MTSTPDDSGRRSPRGAIIAPGAVVWVSAADPTAIQQLIGPLPAGASFQSTLSADVDVALIIVHRREDLAAVWLAQSEPLAQTSVVWLCFPVDSVVPEADVWSVLVPYGWRPGAYVDVTSAWSAVQARPMTADELAVVEPRTVVADDAAMLSAAIEAVQPTN